MYRIANIFLRIVGTSSAYCSCMIFSENRIPLSGIMRSLIVSA